ncbi:MAG: hypothetical protein ABI618_03335, partial [Nitrospirota bacterium]
LCRCPQNQRFPSATLRPLMALRGHFFITTTFTNTSNLSIRKPFFDGVELSGVNILLIANAGP